MVKYNRKMNILAIVFILPVFTCGDRHTSEDLSFLLSESYAFSAFQFTRPDLEESSSDARQIEKRIVSMINSAESEINIWFYGFDNEKIISALERARNRSIRITLMGSPDQSYPELAASGLPFTTRTKSGLQHTKVILIDNRFLVSGTGNFTRSGLLHNNNAFIFLELQNTQAKLLRETLNHEQSHYPTIHLPFNGKAVLAPLRGNLIRSLIADHILNAESSVKYMIFSHTDPLLTSAIFIKAASGVRVEGIYNDTGGRNRLENDSEGYKLNESLRGTDSLFFTDGNRSAFLKEGIYHGGHLHHKTLIIDERIVITGSFNWSASARNSNLEILYIFDSREVAAAFMEEYNRVRERAFLQPRAFHGMIQSSAIYTESDLTCSVANNTGETTVFSGTGIAFRAIRYFQPIGCIDPLLNPVDLAGIAGKTYGIGLQATPDKLTYEMSLDGFAFRRRVNDMPCSGNSCKPLSIRAVDFSSGWIWFDENHEITSMQIWDSSGLGDNISVSSSGNGFYSFTPTAVSSDSILFLKGVMNNYISCIQGGVRMENPLQNFLDGLAWYNSLSLSCYKN